jgi:hypothetical protein
VRVIQEMLHVARHVVVISDANRFGQGSFPLSVAVGRKRLPLSA